MTMRGVAYALVVAFVFAIPWEQTIEYSSVGTISRLIGVAAGLAWAIAAISEPRMQRLTSFHAAVLMFVVWNGLTVYWSRDPENSATGFLTYVQLLVMLVILWDLVDSAHRVRALLQAYVLGGFVAVGGVVWNFIAGDTTVYLRYSSPGSDVDGAALILALGIPAAIYLAMAPAAAGRSAILRTANYLYIPAAAFAIVLTATRGAVLASIPTAAFLLWAVAHGGTVRRLAAVAALVLTVFLVSAYAPAASLDRIASASTELSEGGDLNGRVTIWRESVDAFLGSPLLGVGHDAHRAVVATGKVAHNTPLSILVETGLVGFLLFINIAGHVFVFVRRQQGWEAWYWLTQLAVVAVGAMSLSVEDRKSVWVMVALAVSAAAPLRSRALANEPTPHAVRASWSGAATE